MNTYVLLVCFSLRTLLVAIVIGSVHYTLGNAPFSSVTVPSALTVSVPSQTTTSLAFSWNQPSGEVVDTYMISLDYQGGCTDFNPEPLTGELTGGMTEVTFGSTNPLQEFSDYTFTVTAVNGLGSSPPTSMTVKTLPSGETIYHNNNKLNVTLIVTAIVGFVNARHLSSSQWSSTKPNSLLHQFQ